MLADVTGAIEGFRELGPAWDGATACRADETAVFTALELLRAINKTAPRRQCRWEDPQVAPDPDGGVDIHFAAGGSWVMLTVIPHEPNWVQVTSQRAGEETKMRRASLAEAVDEALSLMEPMVVFGPAR